MEKEGKILTRKLGKTTLISLNFTNYSSLLNSIIELEYYKTTKIIAEYPFFKEIQSQLLEFFNNEFYSICCNYTRSNLRRNRIELTIITYQTISKTHKDDIFAWISNIAISKNIRIDYFIITINKFKEYLQTEDFNYVKEILYNRICLIQSYNFWNTILPILSKIEDIN